MKNDESAGQTPSEQLQTARPKSLLVLKYNRSMSEEDGRLAREYLEPIAKSLGAEVVITDHGADVGLTQDLGPLVSAIAAQTEAITRLAISNEALVEALAQDDEEEDGAPTYLDGSRSR